MFVDEFGFFAAKANQMENHKLFKLIHLTKSYLNNWICNLISILHGHAVANRTCLKIIRIIQIEIKVSATDDRTHTHTHQKRKLHTIFRFYKFHEVVINDALTINKINDNNGISIEIVSRRVYLLKYLH